MKQIHPQAPPLLRHAFDHVDNFFLEVGVPVLVIALVVWLLCHHYRAYQQRELVTPIAAVAALVVLLTLLLRVVADH